MAYSEPMADDFVTVARYADPISAQMAVDVLRQEGIVATAPGVGHSGVLGAAGSVMLQIVVQVRQSDALAATELLEALEEGGEVVDEDAPEELRAPRVEDTHASSGEGPYRDTEGELPLSADRKSSVGISVALFLTFGAGHFYAREKAAAVLLSLMEVSALFLAFGSHSSAPMMLVPAVMAVDVFGVPGAVRRHNAGEPRSAGQQLLRTAIWLALAATSLYVLGRFDPNPPR